MTTIEQERDLCQRCGKIDSYSTSPYCGWCGAPMPLRQANVPKTATFDDTFSSQAEGVVYLVKGETYFKIGKTTDIDARVPQIRLQMPFRVELVHAIHTNNIHWLERHWHKYFAHKRLNGEWFQLDETDVQEFIAVSRLLVERNDPPRI
jgi:hypothetical protein